jgi:hypothetical protein
MSKKDIGIRLLRIQGIKDCKEGYPARRKNKHYCDGYGLRYTYEQIMSGR